MTNALATAIGAPAAATYASVAAAATAYLEARAARDTRTLAQLCTTIWHAKRADADGVTVVERAALLDGADAASGEGGAYLSSVSMCAGDFEVARADRFDPPASTFMLLFKDAGAWRIAGEARVDARTGKRDAHFAVRNSERDVLDVLEAYYRAVTEGDPDAVPRIFAPCWHMKNHENGALVAEGAEAFAARLVDPLPIYWSDRQVADIQIAFDRIAYVRVDRPSTPGTTVFLFARIRDAWRMIDKAWTDGRNPPL